MEVRYCCCSSTMLMQIGEPKERENEATHTIDSPVMLALSQMCHTPFAPSMSPTPSNENVIRASGFTAADFPTLHYLDTV